MNVAETLRGILRRWYIAVPGLVLAVAVATIAWLAVPPAYQRGASVLLLPGMSSLPEEGSNPYLYLGGLTSAAEVLVRAVGSENTMREVDEAYPGTRLEIGRDGSAGGPVIRLVVTAPADDIAAAVVDDLLQRTGEILEELQSAEGVPAEDRITVSTITVDAQSTLQQRSRMGTAAGAGVGVALISLVAAAVADGLTRRRRVGDAADGTTEAEAQAEAEAEAEVDAGGGVSDERVRVPDGSEARPAESAGAVTWPPVRHGDDQEPATQPHPDDLPSPSVAPAAEAGVASRSPRRPVTGHAGVKRLTGRAPRG